MRKTILSLKHRAHSLLVTAVMLLGVQSAFAAVTYTVVAGDKNDPGNGEGLQKLFDGNSGTKWGNNFTQGQPQYFIVKTSEAMAPDWYTLVTANDTGSNPGRNWKTWKIYGTNADIEAIEDDAEKRASEAWVLIDSKENIGPDQLPAANYTDAYFLMEKPAEAYVYFKVEIEACIDANPYMQMAEFYFGDDATFNSISSARYDEANGFVLPAYFQKSLESKNKTAIRNIRYAENIIELGETYNAWLDMKAQILASAEAYQNYISTVASVVTVKDLGYFNEEGKALLESYMAEEAQGKTNEFPNGNYQYVLQQGKLDIEGINKETVSVSRWIEAYSTKEDITEGYIDVTYTALEGTAGFNDSENYTSLVDGDDNTKWCSSAGNYYIIIKASAPVAATYYRLFTSGDTGSYPERNWKSWKIFAANFDSDEAATKDAAEWVLIDDKQNSSAIPAASNLAVNIFLSNPSATPYQYYKIEISDPTGLQQMSEFGLFNQWNFYKTRQDQVDDLLSIDQTAPSYKGLLADFNAAIEEMRSVTTLTDLSAAYNKAAALRDQVQASIDAYKALTELIEGLGDDIPETIAKYATEKSAPGESFVNGSYAYIIEAQELTADQVNGEINYVKSYLNPVNGFIVLAGNTAWGDGENWTKLIDGDLTTKWGGARPAEGSYLIFKALTAQAPYFYTLVTGNDTEGSYDRNWADWTIYAANFENDAQATRDNEGWTVISEQKGIGQDRLPAANFAHAHFDFANTPVDQEYTYFRVEVPTSYNNGGTHQMTELIFKSAEDFAALKTEVLEGVKTQLYDMGANAASFLSSNNLAAAFDEAQTVEALLAAKAAVQEKIDAIEAPALANGYYQVGTAEELVQVAKIVNELGFVNAKVQLTADLDMADVAYTPIGTPANKYVSTFDGQGHKISNLVVTEGTDVNGTLDGTTRLKSFAGVFGVVGGGATIMNFTLDNTCSISASAFTGIIGGSSGSGTITMLNLGNEGNVSAEFQNAGGIIGVNMGSAATFYIKNCYTTGKISGGNESAAISGWTGGGSVINCWSTAEVTGNEAGKPFYRGDAQMTNCYNLDGTQAQAIPEGALESGELAYVLNGDQSEIAWYQTLGEDKHPVLTASSKKVYAAADDYNCDGSAKGEVSYTNDEVNPNIPPHEYDGFTCVNCGQIDPNYVTPVDGVYAIGTADQLAWFARLVNTSANKAINAKLTADIDMSAYTSTDYTIGVNNDGYAGTFDGQGHTVNVAYVNNADGGTEVNHSTALFRFLKGGTVKNIITTGTIETNQKFASGLVGKVQGTTGYLTNVETYVVINSTVNGDGTHAGFVGVADSYAVIQNALSAIVINGEQTNSCGGFIGWASAASTLENCLMIGEINVQDNGSATFSRNPGSNVYVNTYYKDGVKELQDNDRADAKVSAEQLASGEVTWLLNGQSQDGVWKQTLGADEHPTLNQNSLGVTKLGESYVNVEGDVIQIASADAFAAFVAAVNDGQTNLNAALTADFDYSGDVIAPHYAGTFDGKFHTINIDITSTDQNFGLFRGLEGTVRNLNISGLYTSAHNRSGVICGEIFGGLIENCWVSADIAATFNGDGAIAGICGRASGANSTIRNCVFSGNVEGVAYNCAGIVGWSANAIAIENCLVTGEFKTDQSQGNARPIARHADDNTNAQCVNCYYVNPNGTLANVNTTQVTAEQVASGEVAVLLGAAFRQCIGEDANPVLDPTHGIVKEITEAGYATMYIPETSVTVPEGVEAFTGNISGDMLVLNPLESVVTRGQAVVLKGAAGFYSFIPTDAGLGLIQSDLIGTAEDLEADGSQYVLAKKDGTVGFYKAEGTIAAGKAYLLGGANVKGFGLSFDGVTGIAESVAETTVESNAIYDLSGRRVEKALKGIYIINGKKVLK